MKSTLTALLALLLSLAACSSTPSNRSRAMEGETASGAPLVRPQVDDAKRKEIDRNLTNALIEYNRNPASEDAAIWYVRRLGYAGRYNEAIDIATQAIARHPQSYRLLRHRGHRYITLRQFDSAIADLTRAAELFTGNIDRIEPDGQPNSAGIARSTDWFNIAYHLGIAHYMKGEYQPADDWFARSLETPLVNDDLGVAATYWRINCHVRGAGAGPSAITTLTLKITPYLTIVENDAYRDLCLLHQGTMSLEQVREPVKKHPDQLATRYYGIALWLQSMNRNSEAEEAMREVVADPNWPAFGHIAAEVDLNRSH